MEEIIEYGIIGLLALGVIYLLSPTLIDFYDTAAEAINESSELSDSEVSLVTAVLLLLLIMFFVFAVYIFWKAVQKQVR